RPERRILRWSARPLSRAVALEVFTDVTAEVDLQRERTELARADWLTGLADRRGGEVAVAREVARARRLGTPLCFVLFDVDDLGALNERDGRYAGDQVVRDLARIVVGTARGSDVAIRWGGDEILVALPGVREGGARAFAERIRRRVEVYR